jgi:hypothetical protein
MYSTLLFNFSTIKMFTCHSGKGVDYPAGEVDLQTVKRPKQEYVHLLVSNTKYYIPHSHFSYIPSYQIPKISFGILIYDPQTAFQATLLQQTSKKDTRINSKIT